MMLETWSFFAKLLGVLCLLGGIFFWVSCQSPSYSDWGNQEKKEKVFSMYQGYKKDFPKVEDITVEELLEVASTQIVVIVDVREKREQKVSMIPGAITQEEFKENKKDYQNHLIVPYCTIGYRSGKYAEELQKEKFRVKNLAGSILAWTHAGQDLVNSEGKTKRAHVYGQQWNLVAEGYEGVTK